MSKSYREISCNGVALLPWIILLLVRTLLTMRAQTQTGTLFALFALGFILSPWPLGSNRDWAWPLLTVFYVCAGLGLLVRPQIHTLTTQHAKICMLAFAASLAWLMVQWFGIPGLLEAPTIDSFATRKEFLKTVTYACVFMLAIQLLRSQDRITIMIYCVILTGLLEALLGGIQQLIFDMPRARGSFPNPNHFAGYLEMVLGIAIGLILATSDKDASDNQFSVLNFLTGPLGRLRLIIIILVVALVMTRSRMGNIAFFSSLLLSAAVAFYYSRSFSRYTAILLASILALDALIIGNYFGIERLGERLRNTTSEQNLRVDILDYNLQIFQDHLWFGSGPGTYEAVFPPYRDALLPKKATHAEMDYMELLIELGLLGVLPLVIILATGLHAQVRLLGRRASSFERGIAFGCLAGTVSLLIHGIADVNLQIPSNALLFVLLLAIPIALLESKESS